MVGLYSGSSGLERRDKWVTKCCWQWLHPRQIPKTMRFAGEKEKKTAQGSVYSDTRQGSKQFRARPWTVDSGTAFWLVEFDLIISCFFFFSLILQWSVSTAYFWGAFESIKWINICKGLGQNQLYESRCEYMPGHTERMPFNRGEGKCHFMKKLV